MATEDRLATVLRQALDLRKRDPDHKDTAAWVSFGKEAYGLFKELKTEKRAHSEEDNQWIQSIVEATKRFKKADVPTVAKSVRLVEFIRHPGKEFVPYIPFSNSDPAWLEAVTVGLSKLFTERQAQFVDPSDTTSGHSPHHDLENIVSLGSGAPLRIAIVGDLGTNDKHHRAVLSSIAKSKPHLVIHLGDIYISGTTEECEEFWRIYESTQWHNNEKPPLWSLPGNHEYIDAGVGYFKLVKSGVFGGGHQRHSFFSLESTQLKLQLLGLDTGFSSKNFSLGEEKDYTTTLDEKQAKWVVERLGHAREKKLRTIVLSHHPYFSAFWNGIDPPFNKGLGDQFLGIKPVTAWFWGHDHRFIAYDEVSKITGGKVQHALALGFGACPVKNGEYNHPNPNVPIRNIRPELVDQYHFHGEVYNNGFSILEVADGTKPMTMEFYQVNRLSAPDPVYAQFGSELLS